jgi:hypothetical protein
MTKLLTFDNFFKGMGLIVAVCGLYYALDKRLALMEQKLDYVVETYKDKEVEAKIELAELKDKDNEQAKQLAELKERIIRIYAVLPKRVQIEDEQ